ncbi:MULTISPECIES: hypothetical protein [Nocardia]|uniref:RHIM domain-containing protein n=1 Tax=Nocardia sputorum TaxID=2984338 RepID=A0ABM8CR54_9NOCA|nr:hypothetical protein [Nocardia sputorum]BDT95542.1 hypothetical protein IFM12275_55180 [Nocardia sputorum]BDT97295.1 hypothetical protein IFM12276_03240 [Nocardia sputorum]
MDPVTLIAAAVAAGAATGLTDVATRVVADSYQALKDLLSRRYGVIEAEIIGVERDPQEPLRRQLLAKELGKAGAGEDLEVRAAAEELLRVIEEQAPAAAAAVGVQLTRVEAGGEIEIRDVTAAAGSGVEATDVKAGGSIRVSGVRAGRPDDEDPSVARG